MKKYTFVFETQNENCLKGYVMTDIYRVGFEFEFNITEHSETSSFINNIICEEHFHKLAQKLQTIFDINSGKNYVWI